MALSVLLSCFLLMSAVVVHAGETAAHHSEVQLILKAWNGYKKHFIDLDGRVYLPLQNGDTVSEGQAYALLLASLLDDRQTFDKVLHWTERHLSRKKNFDDHLLAWYWERDNGVTDWNSASDADVDYALALVLAHKKWGDETYLQKATLILADILRLETGVVNDKRYLFPGNWRNTDGTLVLNPSYLSPAHFRIFSNVTRDSRWLDLIEGSYHLILTVSRNFEGSAGVGLVPDWIAIGPDGTFLSAKGFSNRVGWDSFRMPFRIGLDYSWFQESRAQQYLQQLMNFYGREWEKHGGKFFVEYAYSGIPLMEHESSAAYAMSLAAFVALKSPLLTGIIEKITKTFHPDQGLFEDTWNYYVNSLNLLGLIQAMHSPIRDLVKR